MSPATVHVPDLTAACAVLGLPQPPAGAATMEMEILPGCVLRVVEKQGAPTPFVYICVNNLAAAREHIADNLGASQWGPDSVDPETFRLRGCILRGGSMVIDAVQCPNAAEAGVPCADNCNPFLSFA